MINLGEHLLRGMFVKILYIRVADVGPILVGLRNAGRRKKEWRWCLKIHWYIDCFQFVID